MRSMNLQIALSRTTAGVALLSVLALGSGASLLLQPQAAQAAPGSPGSPRQPRRRRPSPQRSGKLEIASSSQTAGGAPEAAPEGC